LMDLEVEVTERSTGQFTAGIGFSSIENVVFTASVSQSNLFGRGQSVSLSARIGSLSQDFVLTSRSHISLAGLSTPASACFGVRVTLRLLCRNGQVLGSP
jgi:outer membrane protein assembly factor BamA